MESIHYLAEQIIAKYKKNNHIGQMVTPEYIEEIIKKHSAMSVTLFYNPIGGIDNNVMISAALMMYVRINEALGLAISKKTLMGICVTIVSDLIQTLAIIQTLKHLKWYHLSFVQLTKIHRAFIVTSGWVYLKVLLNLFLCDDNIDRSVREALNEKAIILHIYKDGLNNYS